MNFWREFLGKLNVERVVNLGQVVVVTLVGLVLVRGLARLLRRVFAKRLTRQGLLVLEKAVLYSGSILVLITALSQLGFKLGALLGAAGVAGVAIGFAAQTSLSNLISGLFLIGEEPFEVGDLISVGDISGVVESIDLLSVKLRPPDNRFIRVPNEMLIKTPVINITHFPIRRIDLAIGVAYKEDLRQVMQILLEVADRNPWSLDEPAPVIIFDGFGDSGMNLKLGVWVAKTDVLALRNSLLVEIKERFDREGIEIPFPHRTLHAGDATAPFPVRIVDAQPEAAVGTAPDPADRTG